MSIVTDLEAIEAALRIKALDITAQADAVAKSIVDLRAIDDTINIAADAIATDT